MLSYTHFCILVVQDIVDLFLVMNMNEKYQFGCHCIVLSFFDLWLLIATLVSSNLVLGARRGRNRMVVGFTTTYAISAYHH
jgi:hypothetical protein